MKTLLIWYKKVERILFATQKVILLIMVMLIVIVNNAQVAGRYIFHYSLPWSEQLSIVLFICIIMLGGNISIKRDDEIRIDLKFSDPFKQKILNVVRDVISLATLIILLCSSLFLVLHALNFKQVISSMQLNYAYVFMVMSIGFCLMVFDKIAILLGRFVSQEESEKEE
jgi:TRAP-type C4-dicarboxylate transport system permease small subunit